MNIDKIDELKNYVEAIHGIDSDTVLMWVPHNKPALRVVSFVTDEEFDHDGVILVNDANEQTVIDLQLTDFHQFCLVTRL